MKMVALIALLTFGVSARADSRDALECVRAVAGTAGVVDPPLQYRLIAKGCHAACPGVETIATAERPAHDALVVRACCGTDAEKLLSLPADTRWQAIGAACGEPMDPLLASLPLLLYAKVNAWLVASTDVTAIAAAKDIFSTKRPLALPLPVEWKGHYTLPAGVVENAGDTWFSTYVLIERGGALHTGSWPSVTFQAKKPLVGAYPGPTATSPATASSGRMLVIADRSGSAARVAAIVRAYAGDVALAVAVGGQLVGHRVVLRSAKTPAAVDPDVPTWLNKAPAKIAPKGTVADLATTLDQLATKKTFAAVIE